MPKLPIAFILVPAAACLAGSLASAQSLYAEKKGTLTGETLGAVVVRLDDMDGDGIRELAVSAPSYQTGAIGDGRVFVYRGSTLEQVWASTGTVSSGDHGFAVARLDDVNGDLISDVLIGAPDLISGSGHAPVGTAGRVQVRSGPSGALLLQVDGLVAGDMFGSSVAGLSDVDGDGVPDFAVGASGSDVTGSFSGALSVHSGATGSTLYSVPGPQAGCSFGASMAAISDMNGDGKLDLLVGATSYDVGNQADGGAVFLLSGADGSTVYTWFGPEKDAHFGWAVADLGDVDGDGVADVGIGAVEADAVGVGISAGAVYAYSGASKGLIFARHGEQASSGLGRSVAAIEDVSGDGLPDVLSGGVTGSEIGTYSGLARVFAGTTGAELGRVYGGEFKYLGWSLAAVGDLDQDGRPEFAVSALDGNGGGKGLLRIYTAGWPMPPSTYCTAKLNSQGCAPTLVAQGTPTLSGPDDFVVTAIDVINNKPGVFLWGLGAQKTFAFNSVICIAPPMTRTGMTTSGGNPGGDDCSGTLSFQFSHAYLAQQGLGAGADVHVQAWYRDPALPFQAAGLSKAMTFFLAP